MITSPTWTVRGWFFVLVIVNTLYSSQLVVKAVKTPSISSAVFLSFHVLFALDDAGTAFAPVTWAIAAGLSDCVVDPELIIRH